MKTIQPNSNFKKNKHKPCARNLQDVPMHRLSDIIEEVGGYKVITPASFQEHQQANFSEEVVWWWQLKKKADPPKTVFGTREQ